LTIASGAAGSTGSSSVQEMRDSIDWVAANAGKGSYAHVDGTRIATAGQSCGGLEALEMRNDTRVSTLGIFDSGEFGTTTVPLEIHVPVFYFMGVLTDIACANVCFLLLSLPSCQRSTRMLQ
jgi:dienelactone hydrolase